MPLARYVTKTRLHIQFYFSLSFWIFTLTFALFNQGPVYDPDCNEVSESVDFPSEYSCECTEEWILRRCDEPNLCLSQPCHPNATCQIGENGGYECLCQPGWPCDQSLTAGEISAIVLSTAIIVLTIVCLVLILIIYLKWRRRGKYVVEK